MVPSTAAVAAATSSDALPLAWQAVRRRVEAGQSVPRGLLLRAMGCPVLLRRLLVEARDGRDAESLAASLGLDAVHAHLVAAALRARRAPARAGGGDDRELAARLRADVEAGLALEEIIERHGLSQSQRLTLLARSGLARSAAERRRAARAEVQQRMERQAEVPQSLLATATGLSRRRVADLVETLKGGTGLMQAIQRHGVPWADGRLIASCIEWSPSWRRRERRVGRLTLSEVLSRAAANEDPVWIAEAAGVRAQWIRHVLSGRPARGKVSRVRA
jgi:hypothetical protein